MSRTDETAAGGHCERADAGITLKAKYLELVRLASGGLTKARSPARWRNVSKLGPRVTTRGWLRRAVIEAQNSAESLQATNETAGRLLDEGHDLRKQPATEPVSQFGEASAIAVIEAHALSGEPGLQQSILFAQKRDDVRLPTLEPKAASSNWNGSTVEVYAMPPIHLWLNWFR